MEIPAFDIHGTVPPLRPGADGASPDRSPYRASVGSLCERFGTSSERRHILDGLLRLRAELRTHGLADGFQWLDGSFVEDVETTRSRAPRDVDVVTFLRLGDPETVPARVAAARQIFDNAQCKRLYQVDHYVVQLDLPLDASTTKLIAYWYSMWSHRRGDSRWKGFVQLDLSEDDAAARTWLEQRSSVAAPGGDDVA